MEHTRIWFEFILIKAQTSWKDWNRQRSKETEAGTQSARGMGKATWEGGDPSEVETPVGWKRKASTLKSDTKKRAKRSVKGNKKIPSKKYSWDVL